MLRSEKVKEGLKQGTADASEQSVALRRAHPFHSWLVEENLTIYLSEWSSSYGSEAQSICWGRSIIGIISVYCVETSPVNKNLMANKLRHEDRHRWIDR